MGPTIDHEILSKELLPERNGIAHLKLKIGEPNEILAFILSVRLNGFIQFN